jgi:hypothetical protein
MRRTGAMRTRPAIPMRITAKASGRIALRSEFLISRSRTPAMRSSVATQVAKVMFQGSKVCKDTSKYLPSGV